MSLQYGQNLYSRKKVIKMLHGRFVHVGQTLTDLQILSCGLHENALCGRAPPGPAGGAIALPQAPGGSWVPIEHKVAWAETYLPSGILVHTAVWPQRTLAENWGLCPFREGELGSHLTQCRLGRGLPPHQIVVS